MMPPELEALLNKIPPDNPYSEAFLQWHALPSEQRRQLDDACHMQAIRVFEPDSSDIPSPALRDLVALPQVAGILQAIVRTFRAGAETPAVDWGNDSERPHALAVRRFFHIALAQADLLTASDPLAAATLAADILAFSRHASRDACVVMLSMQNHIDFAVIRWIARRLSKLPRQVVSEIQRRLSNLPRGGEWGASLLLEKPYVRIWMDQIFDYAAHTLAPGIRLFDHDSTDLDAICVPLAKDHPLLKVCKFEGGEPVLPQTLRQWALVTREIENYYDLVIADFYAYDFAGTKALYQRLSPEAQTLTVPMDGIQQIAAAGKIHEAQLDAILSAAVAGKLPVDSIDPITKKPFRIIPSTTGNVSNYIIESELSAPPMHHDNMRLVVGPEFQTT